MIDKMPEIIYKTWRMMGVEFEDIQNIHDITTIYVSVPERSYHKDANGNEMAGMHLASRLKSALSDMEIKNFVLKARIRTGVYWTPTMEQIAEEVARVEWQKIKASMFRQVLGFS